MAKTTYNQPLDRRMIPETNVADLNKRMTEEQRNAGQRRKAIEHRELERELEAQLADVWDQ